jgi:hypothetical protein
VLNEVGAVVKRLAGILQADNLSPSGDRLRHLFPNQRPIRGRQPRPKWGEVTPVVFPIQPPHDLAGEQADVRPMSEKPTGTKPRNEVERRYSPAERRIIALVTKHDGRTLTQEEINLALEQAKAIHGDDLTG